MQARDVIGAARQLLNDTSAARWADATLFVYLSDALRRVADEASHLLMADSGLVQIAEVSNLSQALPFPESTREPLTYLVAARCAKEDGDDRTNRERAAELEAQALGLLRGGRG